MYRLFCFIVFVFVIDISANAQQDDDNYGRIIISSYAPSKLPSPAAYFDDPAFRELAVSPDGRFLAAARDLPMDQVIGHQLAEGTKKKKRNRTISLTPQTNGNQLIIIDLDTLQTVRAHNFAGHSIYGLHWANNERLIASVSASFGLRFGNNITVELPAARTLSIDWKTGNTVLLFGKNRAVLRQNLSLSHIVDPLMNDPDHVLMSAYRGRGLDLWKVNVQTGDSKKIADGGSGTFGWIADKSGNAAFRLDKNRSATVMRAFARRPTGGWSKVAVVPMNEKGEAPEFWPIAAGDNENEIYVLSTPKSEATSAIRIFDLDTGQFTATEIREDAFDIGGGLVDPNTGDYLGAWLIKDRFHLRLKDRTLQKHIDGINRFFDDEANVYLTAVSRDNTRMIVEVTGPRMPGDVYVYDYEKNAIDPLFSLRPKLTLKHLSAVETIKYRARDGLEITAYVTHPNSIGANAPAPLIVMPHGGPAARDSYNYDATAQFLASRGYRVFQPNFRGSSGYGRAFKKAGFREWGGAMQDDLTDGVEHIRSEGLIQGGKVCIVGSSYGGYAALYAAMAEPKIYACAVSIAGVTDLIDLIKYERESNARNDDAYKTIVERIGRPKEDKEMLTNRSPARNAAAIDIPLLIIHGRQDEIVPYAQAQKMMEALDAAERPYEKYIVNDGHSFSRISTRVQTMRKIEYFLAEHL